MMDIGLSVLFKEARVDILEKYRADILFPLHLIVYN